MSDILLIILIINFINIKGGKKPSNWVWCLSICPSGMYLVAGCEDGLIRIYNTETRVFIGTVAAH